MSTVSSNMIETGASSQEKTNVFGKPNMFIRSAPNINTALEIAEKENLYMHDLLMEEQENKRNLDMRKLIEQLSCENDNDDVVVKDDHDYTNL